MQYDLDNGSEFVAFNVKDIRAGYLSGTLLR